MFSRAIVFAAALLLVACGSTDVPSALKPIDPDLDETGFMRALVDVSGNADQPPTLLQAAIAQGVPLRAAKEAFLRYDTFAYRVKNAGFMVVIDMTLHSSQKRFWMINRASGKVDALTVAHGAGSDPKNTGFAQTFSNVPDSKMSSLGSYLISEKYVGRNGDSMRLDGLERTNLYARDRAIVLHPAMYVKDGQKVQGRSWGCPAIPYDWIKTAISRLANGSFMYIYGVSQADERGDRLAIQRWELIPRALWVNESEEAPIEGVW